MRLVIGPFGAATHVRTRDYYQAVRREAALLGMEASSVPRRYEETVLRLYQQLALTPVTEAVDRAFMAGAPAFTATTVVPDEGVAAALKTCAELTALLEELDGWVRRQGGEVLVAPADVHAYERAFLGQVRAQLEVAG
jgi:hypothetical protein